MTDKAEIEQLLALEDKDDIADLFEKAYQVKTENVGRVVYLRGLIELSNICQKNCCYCGIRRDNQNVDRYQLSKEEILREAKWIYENRYGSIVLQAGERDDGPFIDFIEELVSEIKQIGSGALGITLSLGEQSLETYRRWFKAGAHRYLLRIETSNSELYKKIHPPEMSFENRVECLKRLNKSGYQVGTGVMIGIPGQTLSDLAGDVHFFKEYDIDMIGMGPFIPHKDTPMGGYLTDFNHEEQFLLGLKMIAVTRIALEDINIAAATALQALKDDGRELALKAGANIIMPNVTDTKYRHSYQLYENKPCIDENSNQCKLCLLTRISSAGEAIGYEKWGDSPHFSRRQH
jgi:biotin synthase